MTMKTAASLCFVSCPRETHGPALSVGGVIVVCLFVCFAGGGGKLGHLGVGTGRRGQFLFYL